MHSAEELAWAVTNNPRLLSVVVIPLPFHTSESAITPQACLSQLEMHLGKGSLLVGHFPPPQAFQTQRKEQRPSRKCPPVLALLVESVTLPQGLPGSGIIGLFYYTAAAGKTKSDSLRGPPDPIPESLENPRPSENNTLMPKRLSVHTSACRVLPKSMPH